MTLSFTNKQLDNSLDNILRLCQTFITNNIDKINQNPVVKWDVNFERIIENDKIII
jgi:hypothetical protein